MKFVLATLLLLPSLAFAQASGFSELADARGTAMGGAFRGLGLGPDATLGNPASLAAVKVGQFELSGAWDPGLHEGFAGITLRDSETSQVAAGVDYHYLQVHDVAGNKHSAHLATLAIGFPLTEGVLVGVTGKYLSVPGNISSATMDAGLAIAPAQGLVLGFSGHNLVDTHHPDLARFYSLQVGYTTGAFAAEFDVNGDPWRDGGLEPLYDVGAEYVLAQSYPLEAGFAADTLTGAKYVSAGVGVAGQSAGLNLAYRHQLNGDGRLLVLSFVMPM